MGRPLRIRAMYRDRQSLKKDPTVIPEPTGRKGEKSVVTAVV